MITKRGWDFASPPDMSCWQFLECRGDCTGCLGWGEECAAIYAGHSRYVGDRVADDTKRCTPTTFEQRTAVKGAGLCYT